jgi:hypothetical protein
MAKNLSLKCGEFDKYLVDTYEDYIMNYRGIHYIFRFPNGYGASVVKCYGSEGYPEDLWELCTILYDEESEDDVCLGPRDYILVYPVQVTGGRRDAVGMLTDEEVCNLLTIIKQL